MTNWLSRDAVRAGLLAEARAQLARLGHVGMGFAPTLFRDELVATCTRCWMTATISVRAWRGLALRGPALAFRCKVLAG